MNFICFVLMSDSHVRPFSDRPPLPSLDFVCGSFSNKKPDPHQALWHHLRQAGLEHRIRMLPEGLDAQVPKISPKMVVVYRCFGE